MALYFPAVCEHANAPMTALFSRGVPRALITAYPFITGLKSRRVLDYFSQSTSAKMMIMDSGIYTLIKESNQGGNFDRNYYLSYTDKYIKMIKDLKWKFPVVEVDTQNALPGDYDLLDRLRGKFEDAGLADQTIFTWHVPDGLPAIPKLVKKYKRVALGMREMKHAGMGEDAFTKIVRALKDDIAKIHIHSLGTAAFGIIPLPDNFSYDTTTYNRIALFGESPVGHVKLSFKGGKVVAPQYVLKWVKENIGHMVDVYRRHPEFTPNTKIRWRYLAQLACSMKVLVDYHESERKKNPHTDLGITDPLEYCNRHARK